MLKNPWHKWNTSFQLFVPQDFVIPSGARDLQFAAKCRSLASLGMTIHER
jgi:hypothetical protein